MANDTRRLRVVVTGESQGAQRAVEEVGAAAEQTQSKLGRLAGFMAQFAARGAVALGAVGVAAATMGVSTATQLEQVEVGFTTMLGSAKKAQKFMKELQKFAAETPFEFTELVGSAQRFLAMGFAAKEVIPMLTAVGDAVAAMGGSAESVDAVTRALGQMQAKGKVSAEELMQLTEQGIPALKILADSYGVSTSKMSDMITKGKVMSDKAIPLLIKGLKDGTENVKGFGGMMEKQSETMKGKWSTFMDNLRMGLGALATNFLPQMKGAVETLGKATGNFFAGLEGKGKMKGFTGTVNEVGLGLRAMVGAFKEGDVTSDGLVGKFELLGATVKGVIDAFKSGHTVSGGWRHELELLAVGVAALIDAFKTMTDILKDVYTWFKDNETAAKALLVVVGALVTVTKAHAIAMALQAGALGTTVKSMAIYQALAKTVTALQWAWNGALAAGKWIQMAILLDGYLIKQKAIALWTKVVTAAQWLWNAAMTANPLGLIVIAIVAVVAAVVLLWKNNEAFRNFVINKLWPSIKRAWEQLKAATMVVVNALITAWNAVKNALTIAFNAVATVVSTVVGAIGRFLQPLFSVIAKIATVIWGFYEAVWKVIWILIQVAVKLFVMWFQAVILPGIKVVLAGISVALGVLHSIWLTIWGAIKAVAKAVADWFMNTILPSWKRAFDQLMGVLRFLGTIFSSIFNAIRDKVATVFNAIAGPIAEKFNAAINKIRQWMTAFKNEWNRQWDLTKLKITTVWDAIVKAFNKGKDGIKKAWDSVVSISKKPINFVINDIYNNRIMPLWNKVAEKFGIKTRLDRIQGFARGGVVGSGIGSKDDQLAMLTRGEGILTTKEMRRLGGPKGFEEFRQSIAQYNKGGVVGGIGDGPGGWFKSLASKGKELFQGVAGKVISPLVSAIRTMINGNLQGGGMSGLMRGGAHTILDKMVGWVTKKDKEIPALGSAGLSGGYRAMQALIKNVFPQLSMWSGFRPGARTLSGNPSYHGMGRAVDYAPNKPLAAWIYRTFGGRSKEIITPWHEYNVNNGKKHRYTGAVWNQHNFAGGNAHVHWAMDGYSEIQPGWGTHYNGTGKPEKLANVDLIRDLGGGGITINGGLHLHGVQNVQQLRDELTKLSRRNGGRAGLPG